MELTVHLVSWKQNFTLLKSEIKEHLTGSLFEDIISMDVNAQSVDFESPIITPDVMRVIVDLMNGIRPQKHNPDWVEASRYLNLPQLMYYTQSSYDDIITHANINHPANRSVIKTAIIEGHIHTVAYALSKGLYVFEGLLCFAFKHYQYAMAQLLLTKFNLNRGLAKFFFKYLWSGRGPPLSLVDTLLTHGATANYQHISRAIDYPEAMGIIMASLKTEALERILCDALDNYNHRVVGELLKREDCPWGELFRAIQTHDETLFSNPSQLLPIDQYASWQNLVYYMILWISMVGTPYMMSQMIPRSPFGVENAIRAARTCHRLDIVKLLMPWLTAQYPPLLRYNILTENLVEMNTPEITAYIEAEIESIPSGDRIAICPLWGRNVRI